MSTIVAPITPSTVEVGDFIDYTLVTDTRVYEVVKVTAKTITVRSAKDGEVVGSAPHPSGYPVIYTEQIPDPDAPTKVYRLTKHGDIRPMAGRRFWKAPRINGVPVRKTDYSF